MREQLERFENVGARVLRRYLYLILTVSLTGALIMSLVPLVRSALFADSLQLALALSLTLLACITAMLVTSLVTIKRLIVVEFVLLLRELSAARSVSSGGLVHQTAAPQAASHTGLASGEAAVLEPARPRGEVVASGRVAGLQRAVPAEKKKCPFCGRVLPFGDVHTVCPFCGKRLK